MCCKSNIFKQRLDLFMENLKHNLPQYEFRSTPVTFTSTSEFPEPVFLDDKISARYYVGVITYGKSSRLILDFNSKPILDTTSEIVEQRITFTGVNTLNSSDSFVDEDFLFYGYEIISTVYDRKK